MDAAGEPLSAGSGSAAPESQQAGQVAETADPAPELTFREHMWDRFELLWGRRVQPSRKMLEGFVACMRERAQLERQYARGLLQSAEKLQQTAGDRAVPLPLEAVVSNMRHRAEQSAELADELDQDVAGTVDEMLRQHAEVSRRMYGDGQRLMRHWQDSARSYDNVVSRYAQACSVAEDEASTCAASAALRPGEWKRLAEKTILASRQAVAAEKDFTKVLHRFNVSAELQEKQMSTVLNAAQDMEEKRALCFQDAAMKIAVFDTSWLRNVQYDLDSAVQALEDSDGTKELQEFIRENQTQASYPSRQSVRSHWELLGSSCRQRSVQPSLTEKVEALRPLLSALLRSEGVVDSSATSGTSSSSSSLPTEESLAALRASLAGTVASSLPPGSAEEERVPGEASSAAACRAAFCLALRAELQAASSAAAAAVAADDPAAAVGGEPPPAARLTSPAFEAAVSLFQAALDGADLESDAWNGRDLLVLSKLLQLEDGKPTDVLLRVYNHPLWSRVTFWEDALLVGLAEAHTQLVLSRWASPSGGVSASSSSNVSGVAGTATGEVQEVVMTTFLQRYMGYMVALGIKLEQARGCAERTLRKHTALLGSSCEVYIKLITHTGGGPAIASAGSSALQNSSTVATGTLSNSGATAAASLEAPPQEPMSPAALPSGSSDELILDPSEAQAAETGTPAIAQADEGALGPSVTSD